MGLNHTDEYSPKVCRRRDPIAIIEQIAVLVCIILVIYNITSILIASRRFAGYYKINDYSQAQVITLKQEFNDELNSMPEIYLTREEIKREVKKAVPVHFYILLDIKPGEETAIGGTFIPPRLILIDPQVQNEKYAIVLCHELLHLKNFTFNETYTQFQTFVTLYESNVQYLHRAGLIFGLEILNNHYSGDYACIGNIVQYMLNRT